MAPFKFIFYPPRLFYSRPIFVTRLVKLHPAFIFFYRAPHSYRTRCSDRSSTNAATQWLYDLVYAIDGLGGSSLFRRVRYSSLLPRGITAAFSSSRCLKRDAIYTAPHVVRLFAFLRYFPKFNFCTTPLLQAQCFLLSLQLPRSKPRCVFSHTSAVPIRRSRCTLVLSCGLSYLSNFQLKILKGMMCMLEVSTFPSSLWNRGI